MFNGIVADWSTIPSYSTCTQVVVTAESPEMLVDHLQLTKKITIKNVELARTHFKDCKNVTVFQIMHKDKVIFNVEIEIEPIPEATP